MLSFPSRLGLLFENMIGTCEVHCRTLTPRVREWNRGTWDSHNFRDKIPNLRICVQIRVKVKIDVSGTLGHGTKTVTIQPKKGHIITVPKQTFNDRASLHPANCRDRSRCPSQQTPSLFRSFLRQELFQLPVPAPWHIRGRPA